MPDFPAAEYESRCRAAQAALGVADLDALFLTTEAEIRYFTGFRTAFWQSPTRPWFVILPRMGGPVAVIPSIGADLMAQTWVSDIRVFAAPDATAPHLSMLADGLSGFDRIGVPMGPETHLRMPLAEFDALRGSVGASWIDATDIIRGLRMVKSPAEQAAIAEICAIGSAAFAALPAQVSSGQSLWDVFAAFRIALLSAGAEEVPYLVGGAGPGGYRDVISPPSPEPLREGDVLMLDTGASKAGYFCDFDRNWAIGHAPARAVEAHRRLWEATEGALAGIRPGMTAADLSRVLAAPLGDASGIGRVGHGLGMQLTEWPSLTPDDQTVLTPGMVLTLEPSLPLPDGRMMVHEENILLTETGATLLTERAPPELPVIS